MKNFFKTKLLFLLLFPTSPLLAKNETKTLYFIENKGQVADFTGKVNAEIKFTAKDKGTKLFISNDGIHYQFEKRNVLGPNDPLQITNSISTASN